MWLFPLVSVIVSFVIIGALAYFIYTITNKRK
jgi:hypothetical protein